MKWLHLISSDIKRSLKSTKTEQGPDVDAFIIQKQLGKISGDSVI